MWLQAINQNLYQIELIYTFEGVLILIACGL